jgi:hypothetical protein
MDTSIKTTGRDLANGITALQTAVSALGMIAGLGGVQGDWAADALRDIEHTMIPPEPVRMGDVLRLVGADARYDAAGGQGRW